jgi:hypothetical protein
MSHTAEPLIGAGAMVHPLIERIRRSVALAAVDPAAHHLSKELS